MSLFSMCHISCESPHAHSAQSAQSIARILTRHSGTFMDLTSQSCDCVISFPVPFQHLHLQLSDSMRNGNFYGLFPISCLVTNVTWNRGYFLPTHHYRSGVLLSILTTLMQIVSLFKTVSMVDRYEGTVGHVHPKSKNLKLLAMTCRLD
jgi:hypothetical protein